MPSSKKRAPPARTAKDDFKSVAKRLECDEDKERFEKKLGKIAKSPGPKRAKST